MSFDEIDFQISELETRIDRLRALYEQYFMGFERMEPHVPRKDVERRIHDLRKTRFNNTARRFKFQTLIQRYNTLQQYWSRICREIELGTYKRHKLKAERTVGAMDPARFNPDATRAEASELGSAENERRDNRSDALEKLAQDFTEILDAGADLDAELNRALVAVANAGAPKAPAPAAKVAPPAEAAAPEPRNEPAPAKGGLLRKLGRRPDAPDAPLDKPAADPAPANKPITVRPTVAITRDSSRPPPSRRDAPEVLPQRLAETVVNRPGAPVPPPPSAPRPLAPPRRLSEPGAIAPRPAQPAPGAPPRVPSPPLAATKLAQQPAPAARAATPTAPGGALTEAQIRSLHESYQKARAQTNAAPVSFEKLERSLRETERQLREKTKGRAVEFEVKVEAGRAVIKPKLA